jgi:hypothetical protein
MANFADRVKDTTTTTGTGDLTLAGAPPTGYIAFATAFASNDRVYYCISSSGGAEWEVGWGTLSASTTLQRTTILASSNANAVVSLSAGTKDVFCDIPAFTPLSVPVTIRKATADARSSTTLTNDTDFTFAMLANTNYLIRGRYNLSGNNTTMGCKLGLSGPASPTSVLFTSSVQVADSTTVLTAPLANISTSGSGIASFSQTAGNSPNIILDFEVTWRNGANAGTFVMQTARQSGGTATFNVDSEMTYSVIP